VVTTFVYKNLIFLLNPRRVRENNECGHNPDFTGNVVCVCSHSH
jgi:hypothetical protein